MPVQRHKHAAYPAQVHHNKHESPAGRAEKALFRPDYQPDFRRLQAPYFPRFGYQRTEIKKKSQQSLIIKKKLRKILIKFYFQEETK